MAAEQQEQLHLLSAAHSRALTEPFNAPPPPAAAAVGPGLGPAPGPGQGRTGPDPMVVFLGPDVIRTAGQGRSESVTLGPAAVGHTGHTVQDHSESVKLSSGAGTPGPTADPGRGPLARRVLLDSPGDPMPVPRAPSPTQIQTQSPGRRPLPRRSPGGTVAGHTGPQPQTGSHSKSESESRLPSSSGPPLTADDSEQPARRPGRLDSPGPAGGDRDPVHLKPPGGTVARTPGPGLRRQRPLGSDTRSQVGGGLGAGGLVRRSLTLLPPGMGHLLESRRRSEPLRMAHGLGLAPGPGRLVKPGEGPLWGRCSLGALEAQADPSG